MGNRLQRILLIIIVGLVFLLILARVFYNMKVDSYAWEEKDRQVLINNCIDGTAHYGVRFPSLTQEYCECSTDSIMSQVKKAEYLQISSKSMHEQQQALMKVIAPCYNRYQQAIFESTELGD